MEDSCSETENLKAATTVASASLPYSERKCEFSFCSPETCHALRQMFSEFEEDKAVCSYHTLDPKKVKELAESVRAYKVTANYTMSKIERLTTIAMTPTDWQFVTKACLLSMRQYIEWKAFWHDSCQTQAGANAVAR